MALPNVHSPPSHQPSSFHPPAYSSAYPNAGYYPAQPPAAPRRTSPVVWVLAALGLMGVLGAVLGTCGVAVGLMALGASSDAPTSVILGAQVPAPTVDALREKKLLGPREQLLAYYDATIRLDMSEVTFVTATRTVHAQAGTVATMELADVSKITHRSQGIIGEVIDLVGDDGSTMKIQIAPLNGGESYVDVLEDAWQKRRPGAKVVHVK